MAVQKQIQEYIAIQPESKRSDMQALHDITLALMPQCIAPKFNMAYQVFKKKG